MRWTHIVLFYGLLLCSHLAVSAEKESYIKIAIPVSEDILIKTDPHFVLLKRAYNSLDINVDFLVLPGERSFKMLTQGKISGSYPRFQILAKENDNLIITPYFSTAHSIFAFSTKPIDSQKEVLNILSSGADRVGTVRGTKILEPLIRDYNLRIVNHVDHLIGALKAGNLSYVLEREEVIERYKSPLYEIYRSPKPIVTGKVTQILHSDHQDIANKLSSYFVKNPL